MKDGGWYEKTGVEILEGKWQDYVDSDKILGVGGFDVVYIDTFSENYTDLHAFFEHLPDLLAGPESRFSFFNGLGATSELDPVEPYGWNATLIDCRSTDALFYDVYTCLSELHLAEVGVNIDWADVNVSDDESERWGKTREYFSLPLYRLPVGKMGNIT